MNFISIFATICLFLNFHLTSADFNGRRFFNGQNFQKISAGSAVNNPPVYEQTSYGYSYGFCSNGCQNTYCKKNTSFAYKVDSVDSDTSDTKTYKITITNSYKGVPAGLTSAILKVPKNNTKHNIKVGGKYIYMCSNTVEGGNTFVLDRKCVNKLYSSLSYNDILFLNNEPNEYCAKEEKRNQCRLKNCIKKCSLVCKNCEDEETCNQDCKKRCELSTWYKKSYNKGYY